MFLGTGSDVGKSILAAAFCRILKQDGYRAAPFKAQNMALNSFITPEGGEMGRAQVVQAEAAGIEPHVDMNPILLKPSSQMGSQVIVRGRVVGNFLARDYYQYKKELVPVVRECFERLAADYDVIVMEGAGSAVELNLKEHDLVNLGMAEMADAPCILIGDIDRGGIFASLLGSLMLMTPDEQNRIIGFMVNKLRGDPGLFTSGIDILESRSERPVLGVIPHFDHIAIPEEDSVALAQRMQRSAAGPAGASLSGAEPGAGISIGVVRLPFVSNYTDFDCFEQDPDVELAYFDRPEAVFRFDCVIIPGSKNTIEDLAALKKSGLADAIIAYYKAGGIVVGLCGGYQMLGVRIEDPHGVESRLRELDGLGLLEMETEMYLDKITSQVEAELAGGFPPAGEPAPGTDRTDFRAGTLSSGDAGRLYGYEIHMGRSRPIGGDRPLFRIVRRNGGPADVGDGLIRPDGRAWGTYIHGIFDNDGFRRGFLQYLKRNSGRAAGSGTGRSGSSSGFSYRRWKEEQYDRLAEHVRRHADVERIYRLAGIERR